MWCLQVWVGNFKFTQCWRFVAEKSKPTLIRIAESKIDESVTETEFVIMVTQQLGMIEQGMEGVWFPISKKV